MARSCAGWLACRSSCRGRQVQHPSTGSLSLPSAVSRSQGQPRKASGPLAGLWRECESASPSSA
eukprot:14968746-Alexandrium_andersonii.AAC.1